MSTREAVMVALFAVVKAALDSNAGIQPCAVSRADGLPLALDTPRSLVIVSDGDPGEPTWTLSPMTWHYEHRAEIDVIVQTAGNRDAAFDAICMAIGATLSADRTLGGLCEWCEAEAPSPADIPIDGGAPIKAATIPVNLVYSTTDPLG